MTLLPLHSCKHVFFSPKFEKFSTVLYSAVELKNGPKAGSRGEMRTQYLQRIERGGGSQSAKRRGEYVVGSIFFSCHGESALLSLLSRTRLNLNILVLNFTQMFDDSSSEGRLLRTWRKCVLASMRLSSCEYSRIQT